MYEIRSPTKKEFEKKWYNKSLTIYDITNYYKCDINQIYTWAYRLGLIETMCEQTKLKGV